MADAPASPAETLMHFSRIAVSGEAPEQILRQLASATAEHTRGKVAVVQVTPEDSLRLVEARGIALSAWEEPFDVIDEQVGERLRAAAGDTFGVSRVFPIMSHAALFGALVLLYPGRRAPPAADIELARSLTDMAAVSLGRSFQMRELERAYAELRDSREAQARAYKLSALGQMAAGVSHDLKNILNPLSIHLQLLARVIPKDNVDAHQSIDDMREVIQRGVETIDRLRDFSRQTPVGRVEAADLDPLVEEALQLSRARLATRKAYRIALRSQLGAPGAVRVQPAELIAAVVNLVVNAIDAIADVDEEHNITVRTGAHEGMCFVAVQDDGPGIPPEIERRVFEPFFSTKGASGTGLGLANVYAFARRYGGDVSLDTKLGEGTTFTIKLPPAERGASEPAEPLL